MEEKENVYYVYLHRRASDNKVFYVGKGKGKRAFNTKGRNSRWNNTYRKHGLIVEIVFDNLYQNEAFELEIDTILEMRHHYGETLCNLTNGGEGASGAKRSEDTKRIIGEHSKKRADKLSERNSDKETYKFLKLDDLSIVVDTRLGLCEKYKINPKLLRPLFLKTQPKKTACGFALMLDEELLEDCLTRVRRKRASGYAQSSSPRYTDFHCFVAADGTAFWATLDEFENKIGKSLKGLVQTPHRTKVSFGWAIMDGCSFNDAVNKAKRIHRAIGASDKNIYTFIHKESGQIFNGTRAELASEFNLLNPKRLTELFSTRKRCSVYGWSLYKDKNE